MTDASSFADDPGALAARPLAVGTFVFMLRTLSRVLDKGDAHAKALGIDPRALVEARLAPDMLTLAQQVKLACHHAHDAGARLTGGEPLPGYGANDETFEGMRGRITRTIDALLALPASRFEGSEGRAMSIPIPGGQRAFEMTGAQMLRDWSLPNFYFHVVTAYDILRNQGVELGKRDYLGEVSRYLRAREPA